MTLGPGVGSPDWQSYAQWGAALLQPTTFAPANGASAQVFQAALPQWAATLIRISPQSGSGQVFVSVAAGTGGSATVYSNTWNLTGNSPNLEIVVPTYGGSVFVQVTEGTGAGTFQVVATVAATNAPVAKPTYLVAQNFVALDAITVAASSNAVLTLPFIASGRCSINVNQAGAGTLAQIQLETPSAAGVWSIFALFDLANTGRHFYDVALPGQALRLKLLNTATVAVTNIYAAIWTDAG